MSKLDMATPTDAWDATDLDTDSNILKLQEKAQPSKDDTRKQEELAQLKMSSAFIVAEYVEARRDFLKSYEDWLISRKEIILELYQLSNELDKWKKGKDITQAAGSSMGLLGGSLTISGLILMPVTAGTSGVLCAVGLGVGLTGGVTSLSGTIAEILADKSKVKTAQEGMTMDQDRTSKIVKAYETLKLCLFEANFILDRCKEARDMIEQKLEALEIRNSSFMPQGLIHTMKVEQINSALAATKINNEIKKRKEEIEKAKSKEASGTGGFFGSLRSEKIEEEPEDGEKENADPKSVANTENQLQKSTSNNSTQPLPKSPSNIPRNMAEDGQIEKLENGQLFQDEAEDSEEIESFMVQSDGKDEQNQMKKIASKDEEFLVSSKKFLQLKTDKEIDISFETNFEDTSANGTVKQGAEAIDHPLQSSAEEQQQQEKPDPNSSNPTASKKFNTLSSPTTHWEQQIKDYEINKQLTQEGIKLTSSSNFTPIDSTSNPYQTLQEASSSTDLSRGSSLFLGTASSSNGVKEVLSKAVLPGLQVGQQLAVGLSSAFIVVDVYQLFTASRNLNRGSVSETAKVLRMKADQLLEQQLFFNQIYEYIR